MNAESKRPEAQRNEEKNWRLWGPYLSERAWGTVREDYSPGGTAWEHLDHDQARSRVYRWNEDGLGGICDEKQRLLRCICSETINRNAIYVLPIITHANEGVQK